jgi:hypothetical protein
MSVFPSLTFALQKPAAIVGRVWAGIRERKRTRKFASQIPQGDAGLADPGVADDHDFQGDIPGHLGAVDDHFGLAVGVNYLGNKPR